MGNPFDDAKPKSANPFDDAKPKEDILSHGVPDGPRFGMTDDQILAASGYGPEQIKQIKASSSYKPGAFASMMTDPKSFGTQVRREPVLEGLQVLANGIGTPASGALQLANHALGAIGARKPEDVAFSDAQRRIRELDFKQNAIPNAYYNNDGSTPLMTKVLDFGGQAVPLVMLPESKAAQAPTLGGQMLQAAGQGAKIGGIAGLTQPVDPTKGNYAQQVATNTLAGAAGGGIVGGGTPLVSRALAPVAAKVENILQGRLTPKATEMQALSDQFKVPLSVGDITQNAGTQKVETQVGQLPFSGMNTFRKGQMDAASEAAQALGAKLQAQMDAMSYKGLPQVQQAAKSGNKAAQILLNELQNAGDDWNKVVQASGNLRAFRSKMVAGQLYDKVAQLADAKGNVPLPGLNQAIEQAIQRNNASALPDQSLGTMLETLKERLYPARAANGQMQPTVADTSFTGLQRLRSDIGDMVRDATSGGNSLVGQKGAGILQGLKSALESDMETFATKGGDPQLANAWKRADTFYRTQVVPYKTKALAKALGEADADTVFGTFIKNSTTPMQAEGFYKALDPKGQAAVRAGFVSNALDTATDSQLGTFSPVKFANDLKAKQDSTGVFFKGADKMELDGLTKLLSHLNNASKFSANPPTGVQAVPFIVAGMEGGLAMHNPGAAVGVASLAPIAKGLLTSPLGKRLLLAASDAKVGSRVMDDLATKALSVAGAQSSTPANVFPWRFGQIPAQAADNQQPQPQQ